MTTVCTPLTADSTGYTADSTVLTADLTEICAATEEEGGVLASRIAWLKREEPRPFGSGLEEEEAVLIHLIS